jgi:hypothetical protein
MIVKDAPACRAAARKECTVHAVTNVLSIQGTRLLLNEEPFPYQGLSFFNAIYSPAFNRNADHRRAWLQTFLDHGINALRVWCQWDFDRPFVDLHPDHIMYTSKGDVRAEHIETLIQIVEAADSLGMVIEVTLFSHEKQPNMSASAQVRACSQMAEHLRPYRNLILQIWNEDASNVLQHYERIKAVDGNRLVTNTPGFANDLGDDAQNRAMDLLTPHTVRRQAQQFWVVAPQQIASLIETYHKPVIDDEPARTGLVRFGGIEGGTTPKQHIAHIGAVRDVGGYHTYHHDMFQNGYGHPATPVHGIPDPEHPFHCHVFQYLRDHRA